MAKRRRRPQGHPARAAERRHDAEARAVQRHFDALIRNARASGVADDALGLVANLRDLEAGGHVALSARGNRLSVVPLDDYGREMLDAS